MRQLLSIEDLGGTERIYKYLEGMQIEEKKELFGLEVVVPVVDGVSEVSYTKQKKL